MISIASSLKSRLSKGRDELRRHPRQRGHRERAALPSPGVALHRNAFQDNTYEHAEAVGEVLAETVYTEVVSLGSDNTYN